MMKILTFLIASSSFVKGITFNCTFQDVNFWNPVGIQYTCWNAIIGNVNESEELTAIYGTHLSGKSNADVKGVGIQNQPNLTFFPKQMEDFFPNLIAIDFKHNNISSLNGDELNSFPNLILFSIFNNLALERIPGNLFTSTRNLRVVWLHYNNIKHVGEGLLDGLNLSSTFFQNNYCVNQNAINNNDHLTALIEHLKTNCTDTEETTTTTELWTTTEAACGDLYEVVCNLQKQNEEILAKNANFELKIEQLIAENEELLAKNQKLDLKLDQILDGISELSTCSCRN